MGRKLDAGNDRQGDYYYFDHLYGEGSFGYLIFDAPPAADFVKNARKAEINLSGVTVSGGIRIVF